MLKRFAVLAAVAAFAVGSLVGPAKADTWVFDVTAHDYHFEGMPQNVPAGELKFNFRNTSDKRDHELVIFKHRTNKTTQRVIEIAMKDESKVDQLVKFKGGTWAKPGQDAKRPIKASFGAGRYFALCFVSNSRTAAPHFTKGMLHDFRVSK